MSRTLSCFTQLACALLLGASAAASAQPVPKDKLVGDWVNAETVPTTSTLETKVTLGADGTFSGSTAVNGRTFWSFSGTWTLAGHNLTWTYLSSTPALPNAGKVDVDEVVKVSDDELVLKSEVDGERIYRRPK